MYNYVNSYLKTTLIVRLEITFNLHMICHGKHLFVMLRESPEHTHTQSWRGGVKVQGEITFLTIT